MDKNDIHQLFTIKSPRYIYLYSFIIGIITGLVTVLFSYMLAWADLFTFGTLIGLHQTPPAGEVHFVPTGHHEYKRWVFFFLPALGGLLSGFLTHYFSKESAGGGIDFVINTFHHKDGEVNYKVPIIKILASIATLSTGGSGGKEGPMAQIGGAIGSLFATLVGAGARAKRTLLITGAAGGLGAIFRAPLGGALTAVEMMYTDDMESDAVIPCFISSVTAYLLYTYFTGGGAVFHIKVSPDVNLSEFLFYVFLGFLCFLSGKIFILLFNKVKEVSASLKIHPVLKPALGGFIVGCIGFFLPDVVGQGGGFLQSLLNNEASFLQNDSVWMIALIFLGFGVLKGITTSLTIGSGGSAGLLIPSLFIGGSLGGFVGILAKGFLINVDVHITSFMLVGMGGFYSGIARAPIAGMIMICEMIGSYVLLPPLIIVSMIAYILSHKYAIYKGQYENRFKSPAHEWDMKAEILDSLTINSIRSQLKSNAIVTNDKHLQDVQKDAYKIGESDFVVVNEKKQYLGIISLRKTALIEDESYHLIIVEDVLDSSVPSIHLGQSVGKVFNIMLDSDVDKVAVIENDVVIGYVRFTDILQYYKLSSHYRDARK
ncbi:MAG: chloride channel protein [Leptospiraceae bacterium]|nr:chloride channel protein [Leptospiraceae bacterium]MCP5497759.1 chloride channel protein [Leptospiraceae bacterium]